MSHLAIQGDPNGTGTVTIAAPNTNTSRTISLPDASTTMVGTDTTQTLTNKTLVFPSAALVGTPESGRIEYTGTILTATPTGGGRGIIPTEQFYRLETAFAGANATGAQSLFGVGVTLQAGTVYEFELGLTLSKTAGTTSHTISIGFAGTATANNFNADATAKYTNVRGAESNVLTSAAATTITSAITVAALSVGFTIKGTVSINAGGTFIPQYSLSAAPGGAYSTVAGSYFKIKAIGAAGSNTSVGAWG